MIFACVLVHHNMNCVFRTVFPSILVINTHIIPQITMYKPCETIHVKIVYHNIQQLKQMKTKKKKLTKSMPSRKISLRIHLIRH